MIAAGERQGMCELAFNTAGERHGNGMVCVNRPLDVPLTLTDCAIRWAPDLVCPR
jgi:hypothetical protein